LPEPDVECRPDQGSYYSTNANTPFVFTLHPPTPAMTTEYIYSQGRLSPYRAAYHEALSTARRITTPREQCSRRYSKETAISGVTVDENFPVDAHRMTHRYPYGSSRVNEEDLRNARRLSSILAARSTTTTGRMHSLDPIGTRV
uniref:Uncharacterized protein n=1 Tax=Toxocara canis TaxID=6265 RepID=A0A183VEW4_TOXCA